MDATLQSKLTCSSLIPARMKVYAWDKDQKEKNNIGR
uniref:Uncharacterized protein n=1 Tax=Arundo donax TaxID=35708 RepID=A0A0A9G1U9_ARUDO